MMPAQRKAKPKIIRVKGTPYVLLPVPDYRDLLRRAPARRKGLLPPSPKMFPNGNYDAVQAMRLVIARHLIRDRRRAKLSQRALAQAAGVPQSTVVRVESGQFSPRSRTLEKLYAVLAGNR